MDAVTVDFACRHGVAWWTCQHQQCHDEPPVAPIRSLADELAADDDFPTTTYLDTLRDALVDTNDLDDLPVPEAVVADILYADSVAWLQGKPGCGKSFIALDIAGCVGSGETWQGNSTTAGPALFLVAEGTAGLRSRVRAWEKSYGHPMTGVWFLPVAVQSANTPAWAGLVCLAEQLRPRLIVIDTQARVTVGRDENSAQDMGMFVAALDKLRQAAGSCVLVVHHQGRNGEHMRGSTALEGAATTVVRVEKDGERVTVSCAKQKDAAEFDQFTLRLVPMGESAVLALDDGTRRPTAPSHGAMKTGRVWWDTHRDSWVGSSKLVDVVAPRSTVYRHVAELERTGLAEVDKNGKYPMYRLLGDWDNR